MITLPYQIKSFVLASLLFMVVSGCSINTPQSISDQIKPLKIGVTLTLTGYAAHWGENSRKAIDLAVEEVNAEGGINGRPIQVFYEDFGEIDLKAAANGAIKLIQVDNVDLLLTQWSEDTDVALPIASERGIPIITISAGERGITEKSPLLFRVRPYVEEMFTNKTSDYIVAKGATRAAIIYENLPYFVSFKEVTIKVWKARTGNEPFVQELVGDARAVVSKIKEGGYDVIFIRATPPVEVEILRRVKELDVKSTIIGVEGSDPVILTAGGQAADGFLYADYHVKSNTSFSASFKKKYGSDPGVPADLAYDAVIAAAKAMRSRGVDSKSIAEGLLETEFEGASGLVSFNQVRDRILEKKSIVIMKIENGTLLPLKE